MNKCLEILVVIFISFFGLSQAPTADFSTTTTKVCEGTSINFTNLSTAGNSQIQTSIWDFGDGNTTSVPGTGNVEHTYSSSGKSFTVTLLVITKSSVTGQAIKTNYINVLPLPKADFDFSGDKCTLPATISIINNSSTGVGYTYHWDFGNGQSSSSNSPSPIIYSNAGTFSVSLTLSNNYPGCSSTTGSLTKSLTIYDFEGTISGPNILCAESATSLIIKPNRKVDTYSWDFGNQTFGGNNDTVSATYNKAGNYVVAVTMTDNSISCQAKVYYKIQVKPLPKPSFSVDKTKVCPVVIPVQFTNTSSEGTNFVWSLGEQTYTGTNPPSITYSNEGNYTVSLSCKGVNGCIGTTTIENYILVHKPHPKISADKVKGCAMLTTQFKDSSYMFDSNNPIVQWEWDFGNGQNYNGETPPQQIYDVGKFDIKLRVTTKENCVNDTVFKSFIKVGRIEKVNFSVSPTSSCIKTPIQFTDASTILATHTLDEVIYSWDYGDGVKEIKVNPAHAYSIDTGYFAVKLKIDFRGCIDSLIIPKIVYIKPSLARFDVQKLYCNPVMPVSVSFNDHSKSRTTDDVTVNWSFGDGKTGTVNKVNMNNQALGSMSSIFTDYGSYTAIQTVTNHTTGCVDTASRVFYISWVKPNLFVKPDSICQFSSIGFLDASTSFASHPLTNWSFNTGDGGQVSGKNPNYTYKNGGKFEVTVTPTNSVGCASSKSFDSLTVLTLPKAVIVSNKKIGCIGSIITYSNKSYIQNNGVSMQAFLWDFDYTKKQDSTFILTDSKSITYQSVGEYTSYLQVRDKFGCKSDIASIKINITQPSSDYVYKPVVCNQEVFKAYNKHKVLGTQTTWVIDNNQVAFNQDTLTYSFNETSTNNYIGHTISMVSIVTNGCSNNRNDSIKVSLPKANASYHLTSQLANNLTAKGEYKCPPIESKFQDITSSIGTIDSSFWSFGIGKNAIIHNPTINYLFPGSYSVTLKSKDQYGCYSDTLVLQDFLTILGPKAVSSWKSLGDICGQKYAFTLSNLQNVASINWALDDNTFIPDSLHFVHSYEKIQAYGPTVILKDSAGCKVTYPLDTIKIPDKGIYAKFEIENSKIKIGDEAIFKQLSIPKNLLVSWKWSFDDGDTLVTSISEDVSQKYILGGQKNIVLTIKDQNGCSDQDMHTLFVIDDYDAPNVITPNGDGVNDQLVLFDEIFTNYSISIFNRWGNIIYSTKNQKGKFLWDGTNGNNKLMEDGVYFYKLEGNFLDGHFYSKKGSVTLFGKN